MLLWKIFEILGALVICNLKRRLQIQILFLLSMLLKKIYLSNKAGRTIRTCLQKKKIPRQKGEPGSPSGPTPKPVLVQCISTTPSPHNS